MIWIILYLYISGAALTALLLDEYDLLGLAIIILWFLLAPFVILFREVEE